MVSRPLVFDASVLLNLLATREPAKLIRAIAIPGLVCPAVADETLYIRSEQPAEPPQQVSLRPLLDARVLQMCELEGEEEHRLYVQYAMDLDDGEAMSLAICSVRGYPFATDDKKARRLAKHAQSHPVQLVGTPEVVRCWADAEKREAAEVRVVVRRIESSARFRPGAHEPLRGWWDSVR